MPATANKFVWYELMTTDTAGAEKFYTEVVGWGARDAGMPHMKYTLLSAAGADLGGVMEIPPELRAQGVPPHWIGHIGVSDVDKATQSVKQAGGAVRHAPTDIPGIGRFSVVADPQGAGFMMFAGLAGMSPAPVAPYTPGHFAWHELHAADPERAFAFYAGQFGWTRADAHDMGPAGVYQTFATGGDPTGGVLKKMDFMPIPVWNYYVSVADIDAAAARIQAAGGRILHGPVQVPGGSWIVNGQDPQGAAFSVVGPRV